MFRRAFTTPSGSIHHNDQLRNAMSNLWRGTSSACASATRNSTRSLSRSGSARRASADRLLLGVDAEDLRRLVGIEQGQTTVAAADLEHALAFEIAQRGEGGGLGAARVLDLPHDSKS